MAQYDHAIDFGIYSCRSSSSDAGVPSIHSDGRAGDTGFPVGNHPHYQGYALATSLQLHAWELGIQGIIWDRTRYDRKTPGGRRYTGPNPHTDHVHWEQTPLIASNLSLERAFQLIVIGANMAFTPQEEQALKLVAPYASFLAELARQIKNPGPTTGKQGTAESLEHVLEVHRLVAENAGISATDHRALAQLLGQ